MFLYRNTTDRDVEFFIGMSLFNGECDIARPTEKWSKNHWEKWEIFHWFQWTLGSASVELNHMALFQL